MILVITAPPSFDFCLTMAGMSLKINKSSLINACYFHLPVFVYEKVPFHTHFLDNSDDT